MPASPEWSVAAGRGLSAAMACLALGWWGSLAWDASQGRAGWPSAMLAACALLAWATVVFRWAVGLRPQAVRRVHWHPPALRSANDPSRQPEPVRWTDDEGAPLDLIVEMDLGAGVLLRVKHVDAAARRAGKPQWRWIGAQALAGPWRWRLVSASRPSLLPADEHPAEQAMVASWALTPSQKATLPKAARRSA